MRGFVTAILAAFGIALLPSPAAALVEASDIFTLQDTDGSLFQQATEGTPNGYLQAVACRLHQVYPGSDRFEAIFVFSGQTLAPMFNVQTGWPIIQWADGIGRSKYDTSKAFCSNHRLRHAVKMGDLSKLPDDPDALYRGDVLQFSYALTAIELMGHEFGHQWLASATFDKGDGQGRHCVLRAFGGTGEKPPGAELCDGWPRYDYNQHWSYYFNSRSVMYGNFIDDLGNGTFKVWYEDGKYGELDQYLMGLRGPGEVGPQFLVLSGDDQNLSPQPPSLNPWEIQGTRLDFTATDVIRAEGERLPAKEPCHWKGAIVFVWSPTEGLGPAGKAMDKLVTYARRWEEWYSWATDGRGSFDLTRDGRGHGTATCPAPGSPPPGDEAPDAGADVAQADLPEVVDGGNLPDPDAGAPDAGDPGARDPGAATADATDLAGSDRGTPGDDTAAEVPAGSCLPGAKRCDGNRVLACAADGSGWAFLKNCTANGLVCSGDGLCVEDGGVEGGGCAAGPVGSPAGLLAALASMMLVLGARRRPAG